MNTFERAELDHFRGIVASRLGLQFDEGRLDMLGDVLRQRLEARGRRSASRYLASLGAGGDREEVRTLAALLTVTETYFFRAPEHFRALAEVALPERLRALRSARPLRILSASCASGDEAYSVALVLREQFPELSGVTILGVDLNPAMLAKAGEARYGEWALRQTPAALRERYFARNGGQFVLDPRVRSMVAFEERNLGVENGAPWNLSSFDIIFCRNTIMYLAPEAARLTVARLTRALAPGGFLFLSHVETLRGLSHDFHLRHSHDSFYYLKREEDEPWLEPAAPEPAGVRQSVDAAHVSWVDSIRLASEQIDNLSRNRKPPHEPAAPPSRRSQTLQRPVQLDATLELLRQERFREALETMRNVPSEFSGDRDVLLLRAVLLTNCGEVAAAQSVCEQLLGLDDLNASAQYVTALCREHAGDYEGAREHDQAAVYLDPSFAMPHLHLGLIAKRTGDLAAARREMEQAALLLEREDASRILLLGGGFSRQALLEFSHAECHACGGQQ
jgi:chemotaxis protein methyltransferase CheR